MPGWDQVSAVGAMRLERSGRLPTAASSVADRADHVPWATPSQVDLHLSPGAQRNELLGAEPGQMSEPDQSTDSNAVASRLTVEAGQQLWVFQVHRR